MGQSEATAQATSDVARDIIAKSDAYGAHNYKPLPVVLERGEGVWVWDVNGTKYMDMLSAYSALSQGHRHPRIIAALVEQAQRITLTSRAFRNDKLAGLYERLVKLTGLPRVLPMNSGAEAVESAIKIARKWGVEHKGVEDGKQEIIACSNNFHGRTIAIISCSTEEQYRRGFGPLNTGFRIVPYGDADAFAAAITDNTVGFLVEPIQGEAGINIPPEGYLQKAAEICKQRGVMLLLDEVQTGFGRTGKMFCCEHEGVKPDAIIMGKALSGGVYPVSAVAASEELMGVLHPGDHGSTFGGNPLGAAVACAALDVLVDENLAERAAEMGAYVLERLRAVDSKHVREVRGRGLLIGIDLHESAGGARRFCEALMLDGLLCKETHETVIRLAPPLVVTRDELDWALERVERVLLDN
ncbi:MAG: ornithine--oxo-acid transaminase [Myxococcales bacterium]|nr:ornithine--oxo-acid transaminase [Myxococcales bacterium]